MPAKAPFWPAQLHSVSLALLMITVIGGNIALVHANLVVTEHHSRSIAVRLNNTKVYSRVRLAAPSPGPEKADKHSFSMCVENSVEPSGNYTGVRKRLIKMCLCARSLDADLLRA